MDEAVKEAFDGLRAEVGQVRHDISVLRDDLKSHVEQDRIDINDIKEQIAKWVGQSYIVAWLAGAILSAVVAHVAKHW